MLKYIYKKKPCKLSVYKAFKVDPLGLEPRMTVPKTVVLPLHHGSIPTLFRISPFKRVQIYNFYKYYAISFLVFLEEVNSYIQFISSINSPINASALAKSLCIKRSSL